MPRLPPWSDARAEEAYRALLAEMAAEFPGFRLLDKAAAPSQWLLHGLLVLFTLGGQRHYLTRYVTTLGRRVYVPPDWERRPPLERICTLRHERVHLRQFARLGLVPMAVLYLLLPLPVGLAYFRMRLEREAYEESVRATFELLGPERVLDPTYRRYLVAVFCGGAYGWMWPFPAAIERWFDGLCAELVAGAGSPPG